MLVANRYRIENILGKGGMGVVYRAYDRLTRQTVALKRVSVLSDDLDFRAHTIKQTQGTMSKRLGLALEFRTLAGLRHPHIISVIDYGFDAEKHAFFTMNLVSEAQTIIDYARDLPREQQIQYAIQVLQALAYLHRQGIIHRDVKPQNILIGGDGNLKVMDFGLALNQNISIRNKETGVGTIPYMAPELLMGKPASVQTDLYALGVILYELLAGKYPFDDEDLTTLIVQITQDMPDTSMFEDELEVFLLRLMAKDETDRYQNAEEVINALCAATGQALAQETIAVRESYLQAARFVGRDQERQQLVTALNNLFDEQGSIWLIGGESGVGKSRLVDELHSQAVVEGAIVLREQGIAEGGLPFQFWRQSARYLVLVVAVDDEQASILKAVVPDISELLGRDIPDAPELQGDAYVQRIVDTLFSLFRDANSPILLILEDLQWAYESLIFLRHMLQLEKPLPNLLIVGTYRNDERPNLPQKLPGIQEIELPRLNSEMIAELSRSILGDMGQQPELLDFLEQETEGNSFFIVEVLRVLADEAGQLSKISQVELSQRIFTGGMRSVLQKRIEQIPPQYQPIIKFAAVAGKQLDIELLKHAMPDMDIEACLYLSLNAAVLQVSENQWQFTHDKLREAVISDLSKDEREALNQQVAESIEQLHPNDESYHEILMQYWREANNWEKESQYLMRVVGHQALITAEYQQANQLVEYALGKMADTDTRRINLRTLQTLSYLRRAELEQAEIMAQAARASAKAMNHENGLAISLHYLGVIAFFRSNYPLAQSYFEECIAIRRASGKLVRATLSINNLGAIFMRRGLYQEGIANFRESLKLHETTNNVEEIAWCLFYLGWAMRHLGEFEQAYQYSYESYLLRQDRKEMFGVAWSLRELGELALIQGKYEEAADFILRGEQTSRSIDDKWGLAGCLLILIIYETKQGRFDKALEYVNESLELSHFLGEKYFRAYALCGLGFLELETGDSMVEHTFYEALDLSYYLGTISLVLEIIGGYIIILHREGNPIRAAELLGLIQNHPAHHPTVSFRMGENIALLEDALEAETLQSAKQRGAQLELDAAVEELLARIKSPK